MIGKAICNIFQTFPRVGVLNQLSTTLNVTSAISNPWSLIFVRNKVRCYFPHPNEKMRIKKTGWNTKMATLGGRKMLMRRILKGKHVLTH